MAQRARRQSPPEPPDVDPLAISRSVRIERAKRRARLERAQRRSHANLRFFTVIVLLLALFLFFVVVVWQQITSLFGL